MKYVIGLHTARYMRQNSLSMQPPLLELFCHDTHFPTASFFVWYELVSVAVPYAQSYVRYHLV